MGTRQQRNLSITALLLLGAGLIVAVMASNLVFKGWRLDLTENSLYTISDGTKNILAGIEEPINLYFFFSNEGSADIQVLRTYANRVRETLEQFTDSANGNLVLNVIDPVPFSEEEDRAAEFGLQGIRLGALSESIYLGLAATNSVGDQEIIPFFDPGRESFLEYELAKLISTLANPDKTVIGLISGVEMTVGFDPQTQQMREPWVVTTQAQQLFEVRTLGTDVDRIEEDVDVLWVVHPVDLSDRTLYAIDQYVLRAGKALIFVDPLAEIAAAGGMPGDPSAMFGAQGSNLQQLFDAWGIEFSSDQAIADDRYALTVSAGPGQRPVRHLGLFGVDKDAMNREDVTTAELSNLNFGSAGFFTLKEGSSATLEPLVTSSQLAAPLSGDMFRFLPNPDTLRDEFAPTGESYVLAGRLAGALTTAFPDGPPPAEGEDPSTDLPEHIAAADEPANVILVGDVDLLGDRLWVQVQNFFGQRIPAAFANNGDFVINALDNLSGSSDLISIRSRATSTRPFTTVDALRRDADARFRATEQRLQAELEETEQRLTQLQSARPENDNALILSADQENEIQRFLNQRSRIRKELRAVQRELDKSIDDLGTTLKVINIGLMPLVLTLLAVIIVWSRRGRAS